MVKHNAQERGNLARFSEDTAQEQEYFRWQSEKVDLIARTIAALRPVGMLADVGCFTGIATARYKSLGFEGAIGFDISEAALAKAAARGIETRCWTVGAERCPAHDAEFNLVVVADIIEHIVDTDQFMRELRRIVIPKGYVIVTTPNLAFWLSRLRLLLGKSPWSHPGVSPTVKHDNQIDLSHIRIGTNGEWQALFRANGFKIREVRGWSILHAVTGGVGLRVRQLIDRSLTRYPDYAFGLLYLLEPA